MGKVYGYVRVSTEEQMVDPQTAAIMRYFECNLAPKGLVFGEIITEQGVSGGVPLMSRPQGSRLQLLLGKGDALVFSKLDRGFRDTLDAMQTIRRLTEDGVQVHALDLPVHDLSVGVGWLLLMVIAWAAEWERRRIGERMRDSNRVRKAQGRPTSGMPPLGFRIVGPRGNKRLVPCEYTRQLMSKLVEWQRQGWTQERIYFHCLEYRVKTVHGKEIQFRMIPRYIRAELRLRATEAARVAKEKEKQDNESL
jgi:DNA invertase Pin-like site-specific DNA recombinase